MYNASKALFEIHTKNGNLKEATKVAGIFVAVNDSMALGKEQKKTATVTNWYQYMRDREEESRLMAENEAYQTKIYGLIAISIVMILVVSVLFLWHRNVQLTRINRQNELLRNIGQEKESLEQQLQRAEREHNELIRKNAEVKERMAQIETELRNNERKLEIKELAIKTLRNAHPMGNAEETIKMLRGKARQKMTLTSNDWAQLYAACDSQWPELKKQVDSNVKSKVEDRKKICYMKRAGFSILQIEAQTGISRSTIHRFLEQNSWTH